MTMHHLRRVLPAEDCGKLHRQPPPRPRHQHIHGRRNLPQGEVPEDDGGDQAGTLPLPPVQRGDRARRVDNARTLPRLPGALHSQVHAPADAREALAPDHLTGAGASVVTGEDEPLARGGNDLHGTIHPFPGRPAALRTETCGRLRASRVGGQSHFRPVEPRRDRAVRAFFSAGVGRRESGDQLSGDGGI